MDTARDLDSNERPGDDLLDAEIRPIILDWRARMRGRPSLADVAPAQMRQRAAAEFACWNSEPPPVAEVRDFTIADVPVRLYDPVPHGRAGLMIFLHGGGWTVGDLDLEDAAIRRMAINGEIRILSVDYRLAPEHPYPAALDDIETVFRWAGSDPVDLAIDGDRIALGGASAGANLALGAALRQRDRGGPMPCFLMLLYGAYSGDTQSLAYSLFGDGRFGLPRAVMDWFWTGYAGSDVGARPAYAAPLRADLAGLPPAFVSHAELDVLRDDTILLAERLEAAGVTVDHHGYAGAVHGFTQYAKASVLARRALADAAAAVAAAIS